MDKEEAGKILKDILEEATAYDEAVSYVTSEDAEAIKTAIEALKKQDVVEELTQDLADRLNDAYNNGYNAAKREIALSAEYERAYQRGVKDSQEWISCKTRLPKVGTKCLLRYSNGKCSGGTYRGNRMWSVDYNDEDLSVTVADWLQYKSESEE